MLRNDGVLCETDREETEGELKLFRIKETDMQKMVIIMWAVLFRKSRYF